MSPNMGSKVQAIPKVKLANPLKSRLGSKNKAFNLGPHHSKKRSSGKVSMPILGNQDSPNVADRLDRATLNALGQLKQSLVKDSVINSQIKHKKFLGK